MENRRVDILMATYNGEKYLREQIASFINQTYPHWNLLIRDDGSTDGTLRIIEEYVRSDERIRNIKDDKGNLGVVGNFEELLKVSEADLIMFSDQDDIWDRMKIETYIDKLEGCNQKEVLLHSDTFLCDMSGNIIKESFISKKASKKGLENTFFNYFVQGACIMISKELKRLILPFPEEAYLHDRYMHLMAELFFTRIFINKSLMYYRQHENNQIGSSSSLKMLLKKRYFDIRDRKLIERLYKDYGKELEEDKKKLIEQYLRITDITKSRFARFIELKKSRIDIPLKKQLSFLVKG